MLNKAPIFINGFHRGGTNIITNLLASHPDVCLAAGETNEVFQGKRTDGVKKWVNRALYAPVWAVARQHIFHPRNLADRNHVPGFMLPYIDALFFLSKLMAVENTYKAEGVRYTLSEKMKARMLSKNGTAVVLATDILAEMYPDATFIGFVRDGLAVCEGMMRRGFTAEYCGRAYEKICQKMLNDAECMANHHILRFEDMIEDPLSFVEKVYGYTGLDIAQVTKFRFETKPSMGSNGEHQAFYGQRFKQLYWVEKQDLRHCFRDDVNRNQTMLLKDADRDTFLSLARSSMERLGYLKQSARSI